MLAQELLYKLNPPFVCFLLLILNAKVCSYYNNNNNNNPQHIVERSLNFYMKKPEELEQNYRKIKTEN